MAGIQEAKGKGAQKRALEAALPASLIALAQGASFAEEGGKARRIDRKRVQNHWQKSDLLLCHKPFTMRRLGLREPKKRVLDVMELFAFVNPAQDCLPSPRGLASALGLSCDHEEAHAGLLHEAARHMLASLQSPDYPRRAFTHAAAEEMAEAGWSWGAWVLAALREGTEPPASKDGEESIWAFLPKWEFQSGEKRAGRQEEGAATIGEGDVGEHLRTILGARAMRDGQESYAEEAAQIFLPARPHAPHAVLAEAGTGIGKTLGYLAPAHLWAKRQKRPVWISTYTKALQRQIDREAGRFYSNAAEKRRHVVVRKGRDNYLCLLKWERLSQTAPKKEKIFLNLVARWMVETRDGDITGGDFPSWLALLVASPQAQAALTDRRGECLHHACPHYRRCFIERQKLSAQRADLVVTNHALIMSRAARDLTPEGYSDSPPQETRGEAERMIFDEAHHLFEAADSAFTMSLTLRDMREFALWLEGSRASTSSSPQGGNPMAGLQKRLSAWTAEDEDLAEMMASLLRAAKQALPKDGVMRRLQETAPSGGTPSGGAASGNAGEAFFAALREQVLERGEDNPFYSPEAPVQPLSENVAASASSLAAALKDLADPLKKIALWLENLRHQEGEEARGAESAQDRIERTLTSRADEIERWRMMLETLDAPLPEFVDRFLLTRVGGVERDCGMLRHPLDPTKIFAHAVLEPLEGVLITSASLRDSVVFEDHHLLEEAGASFDDAFDEDPPKRSGWESAEMRTGLGHVPEPPRRSFTPSPFDYREQARIFLVGDVPPNNDKARAQAYRDLFLASGGGALGLFTAIRTLRAVHAHLSSMLSQTNMLLLAQHIDAMDHGALVDLFREDETSCLLGTDALRDGIDVPGAALRLILFDKIPWPRPDILHRARAESFGGRRFTEMLTRLRLQQAFGRLIRSEEDRGVFVLLDGRVPSRILSAFPKDVIIERRTLSDTADTIRNFFE